MIALFKRKSKIEKLQEKYEKLMKEAFELSTTNRAASDSKHVEADRVMKEIESLNA